MKKELLTIILSLFVGILYARHEEFQTVKVRGEYAVVLSASSLAGNQAMELAREDARRQAIEKVCGSRVSTWDKVEISTAGETFNSLSVYQVDGEIVDFEVIKEGYYQSDVRSVETVFYCEAKVKVKRGAEPDPNFCAKVEGVHSVYYENDALEFSVTPYRDCYLKIFLFADAAKGYRIYPNSMESPVMLKQGQQYNFPTNNNAEYSITKDTDHPIEVNRLVFVFTKEERPFYHETTSRAEIERWMALIPNDEKFLYSIAFDIR